MPDAVGQALKGADPRDETLLPNCYLRTWRAQPVPTPGQMASLYQSVANEIFPEHDPAKLFGRKVDCIQPQ